MVQTLKKAVVAACAVVILLPLVALAEIKVGSEAPGFSLKSVSGAQYSLAQYKGKKVVYLAFFATWCENCREEMATLKELYAAYKKEGLEILAIDVKEQPDKVKKFIEKHQLPFPVLLDENAQAAQKYQLVGFPSNLIVDGHGKVRFSGFRPPDNFKELFAGMKPTLKAATKTAKKTTRKK